MPLILGVDKLVAKLRDRVGRFRSTPRVIVGFEGVQARALHERLEMIHGGEPRRSGIGVYWGPSLHGPKFLERPARELRREMCDIVTKAMKSGSHLHSALALAGIYLMNQAKQRIPVEYGDLVNSGFCRVEKE